MIRDPLAELWAVRPRGRSSSSLTVPIKHPATGSLVWLSVGQWATLLWLRRRMKHGRGRTTLVLVGAATGAHPGTVTHRLDRLAQLGLVGRRSLRGRHGGTHYWPARLAAGPGSWQPGRNVALSTAYGGLIRAFVTRDGLQRAARRGGSPPQPPGGGRTDDGPRRRPPRLIYERCPRDGGRVRLTAWRFRRTSARLVALWDGICPSCGAMVLAPLVLDVEPDRWAIPDPVGAVLERSPAVRLAGDGRRHRRPAPPSIEPGPRLDRIRELAAEVIAGGELDGDQASRLGARWLGWRPERIPQPDAVAVDVAGADRARAELWARARDHRPVRYSQPAGDDDHGPLSVRDSHDADSGDDPARVTDA